MERSDWRLIYITGASAAASVSFSVVTVFFPVEAWTPEPSPAHAAECRGHAKYFVEKMVPTFPESGFRLFSRFSYDTSFDFAYAHCLKERGYHLYQVPLVESVRRRL